MVPVFLGSGSTSQGPPLLDSGWEHRCESGVLLPAAARGRGSGIPSIPFYIMGSVPYKGGSLAPVVRLDANESLRDANDFLTKSSG